MPLHFGKIATFIVVLTIAAFLVWLVFGAFWRGETVENTGFNATPKLTVELG